MKIAAVADIHGNLPALEAVLADIDSIGVDHVVFCGDIVLGAPDDKACWERVKQTGAPIVRGNTDRFMAEFGTERADPRWMTEQFKPLQYAASQFSVDERQELGRLPTRYKLADVPDVLFYHSNPRNDMDILRSYTPDEDLEKTFSGLEETILVGGHTHTQQTRRWRKHTIVVCGSVGATNDYSAGAQYVLLEKLEGEWLIRHRNVPYDVAETLRRFEETDYLTFAGPIGRLMVRGIATSTNQIMPFLSWYKSGSVEDGLSEAVDKFLTLY